MSQSPAEVPEGAYCAVGDLRTGDIRLPSYINLAQRVQGAAEEIDIAIGHIYKTPVSFGQAPIPLSSRPSQLALKKINWLIASGRILLDIAAASEDRTNHAYGMGMLKEGLAMLEKLRNGDVLLVGAEKIEGEEGNPSFTGPAIMQEDPFSLVESFYAPRDIMGQPIVPGYPYGYPPSIYGVRR